MENEINLSSIVVVEDKNYLIKKITNQIDRLRVKSEKRNARITAVSNKINIRKELLNNTEATAQALQEKLEAKNQKASENFTKALEKRNNRLTKMQNRLESLTTRIEDYKVSIQTWTDNRNERNRLRAEKRADKVKSVSKEGIEEWIDQKELYLSVLQKRQSQAEAFIQEKLATIERIKKEIENELNKPKTKLKMIKVENNQPEVKENKAEEQPTVEAIPSATVEAAKPASEIKPKTTPVKAQPKPQAKNQNKK